MTSPSIPVTVRRRKRQPPATAAATFTIIVTTARGGAGWLHELEAHSPHELRTLVARDVDELVGELWGGA